MKLSVYDLFVSHRYGDLEVDSIFTTIEEAKKDADERNDAYSKMTFSDGKRPYRAMSLDDAIWEIKDYERDNTELRCRDENYDY